MCAQRSEFSSDEELESPKLNRSLDDIRSVINSNGIESIDDETLYIVLKEIKGNVGPIVDSTRKLYRTLLLNTLTNVSNDVKHRNGTVDDEFAVSTEEEEQESEDGNEEEVEVREEDFDVDDENEDEELREPIIKPRLSHQSFYRQSLPPSVKPSVNARFSQTPKIHKIQSESHFLRNAFISGLVAVLISLIVMYNLQETWR